jgi:hypothetical protein
LKSVQTRLSFLFTDSDDSDDFADEEDEPEMDLEMQMAYKEFIKAGKEASRNKE